MLTSPRSDSSSSRYRSTLLICSGPLDLEGNVLGRQEAQRAASGTSISPVAQLLNGYRPARRPNARFLAFRSVKRQNQGGNNPWKNPRVQSLPDLRIDITRCLAAEDGVALEVRMSGTQLGSWRGLPPTGRPVAFPLCGLFSFDEGGMLAGERIYYDRGSVLRQVGLYHDPQSFVGRLEILLAHPITVARAYGRKLVAMTTRRGVRTATR